MSTTAIREKLHHYIEAAKDKKVKAIFAMVEEEIVELGSHWDNEDFVAEMERREKSFLEGKSKGYTIDQSFSKTMQAIKKIKRK